MDYEKTPVSSKLTKKQALKNYRKSFANINELPTHSILWHLVKRHKFGLVVALCVVFALGWANVLPVIFSLIGG